MFAFALAAATEGAEKHRDLPLPPWGYASIALLVFFGLAAVTWAFRSVSHKH